MEWIKAFLGKWKWQILAVVFAGLFAWKMMSPEIKTVDKTVTDTKWQESLTQQISSLKTEFATQMSGVRKELESYKQMAKDIKTVQSTVEKYDPNTGRLIEKILNVVSEDKSKSSTTTTATTSSTSTATSGSTISNTGTTSLTGSGSTHIVDTKTTTTNPQAIVSLSGGIGMKTLDGFKPSDADLAIHVNLFGIKITAMESYEFTGQQDIKDRFKTHALVTFVEFK